MKFIRLLRQLDPNFAWNGSRLCDRSAFLPEADIRCDLRGAAVSVEAGSPEGWRLLRDPLGINKPFWAYGEAGSILVIRQLWISSSGPGVTPPPYQLSPTEDMDTHRRKERSGHL
jgi:hypothetical protein